MAIHLVVGGGEHSATVASRLLASLQQLRPVARPAPAATGDPVVVAIETHLDRVLTALDLPTPVVGDLVARLVPAELPTLLRLARDVVRAREDDLDLVVDVPIEVGRLLDLPQRVGRALAAFVPVLARWEALIAPPGVGSLPPPGVSLLTALREGAELMDVLDRALADPDESSLHLAPPSGPVGAARRADAEVLLALMGRTLTAVHPAGGAGVEYLPVPPPVSGPRVEERDGAWLLRIGVPGVQAADLDLVRHEDDLLLGCAGRSRRILLPPVLRRCEVDRAGVAGGMLTVTMTPIEGVWPRGRT